MRNVAAILLLMAVQCGALLAAGTEHVSRMVGKPQQPELRGPALENETDRLSALLRCPVCQGLSIGDSPATMAVNMKAETKSLLAAGYSREQVLTYFEKSYGEFVRLEPPRRGVNWIVWLAPLAALLLGGAIAFRTLRNRKSGDPHSEVSDPALQPYVSRVRLLAYGRRSEDPAVD